jgi:hypothetical protein
VTWMRLLLGDNDADCLTVTGDRGTSARRQPSICGRRRGPSGRRRPARTGARARINTGPMISATSTTLGAEREVSGEGVTRADPRRKKSWEQRLCS